ncbi:MAG: glycoside hydrolase family 2 protein [Treponema sp.]|nr:glycoside hydrolase family 2 protein [Treponema sp.]
MRRLPLDGAWKLKTFGAEKIHHEEIDAEVPGSVLDAWIKTGLIPDPYYGENERSITPLFGNDFEYSRTFSVDAELLMKDRIELVCLGIDTLGEIFINGKSIARVNNMHRSWRFSVKEQLKVGENTIRLVLFSPNAYIAKAYREGPINYVCTGNMLGTGYLRKAHCQFGWDWGPMLPDAGIWRNIYLEAWSTARLEDVYVTQEHSDGRVMLRAKIKVEATDLKRFWAENHSLKLLLRIKPPANVVADDSGEGKEAEVGEVIQGITDVTELTCVIEEPRLWWPNGLGEQPLYNVEVELLDAASVTLGGGAFPPKDIVLDNWKKRIGLRTMTISTGADEWGNEFALTVNEVKVFAMGADYIPEDSVFPRINAERTRRLLENCIKANFNSIRVWGGGYYPDDFFYDACDELGLVVWQDFMFACNIYHLTGDFAANIAEEARQNMVRIRHHACLGLWCGNNEMELGWIDWDSVKYNSPALKADYIKLFEFLIPGIWKKADPETFYWPSSPSSGGGFDKPNDPNHGDVHFWEVWHGLKPFSEYRKYLFRYCSEFGFESLPDLETIKSFAPTEDLNLFSPVLETHQKNPGGNGKILYYLSETYRYPKDFNSLVYISQALQLESIQSGVDHWRRNRGRCMGAIYWQLNDCWPVVSWASIDYFGRWKALHYGARRFFAPLRTTIFIDETEAVPPGSLGGPQKSTVRVFVHNDTRNAATGALSLFLKDRDFNLLAEEEIDVELPPLSVREVLVRNFKSHINTVELERSCFAVALLVLGESGKVSNFAPVSQETALFVPPKYFSFKQPEYKVDVREVPEGAAGPWNHRFVRRGSPPGYFAICIKADSFCRFTRIKIPEEDVVFSDNYFDITGKEGVEILVPKAELKKTYTAESLKEALTLKGSVFSVGESY